MLAHDSGLGIVPNHELYRFVDPKDKSQSTRGAKGDELIKCVAHQRDPIWRPVRPPCQAAREKSTGPSGFSESRETTKAQDSKTSRIWRFLTESCRRA
jgi:hypothetical protein